MSGLEFKDDLSIKHKNVLLDIILSKANFIQYVTKIFLECISCPLKCPRTKLCPENKSCYIYIHEIDKLQAIEVFKRVYGEDTLFEELL